jgi:hypothetical protein
MGYFSPEITRHIFFTLKDEVVFEMQTDIFQMENLHYYPSKMILKVILWSYLSKLWAKS